MKAKSIIKVCYAGMIVLFLCLTNLSSGASSWYNKKFLASDGASGDLFGYCTAMYGDYAVVGAYGDDSYKGSAYVYKRVLGKWVQYQKLVSSDGAAADWFGRSVAINGNFIFVGACKDDGKGSVFVFKYDGTNWVQKQKISASDGASADLFGQSVGVSGNYAVIGADGDDSSKGAIYIYQWNSTSSTWVFVQKLPADASRVSGAHLGYSVAIDGDMIVAGAYLESSGMGSVNIFGRSGSTWNGPLKLASGDTAASGDNFGYSVSISGNRVIAGAYNDDNEKGTNAGIAYIYKYSTSSYTWSLEGRLIASDGGANKAFGKSVYINGTKAIIGSPLDGNGSSYVFTFGSSWTQQQKITAPDADGGDNFGGSVGIYGNYAISGTPNDEILGTDSGSAYILEYITPGAITLLTPNGGENIVADSKYNVTWNNTGTIDYVNLKYSVDDGNNWTLSNTVANTGSYLWRVADVNSTKCKLRISDAGMTDANDASNNRFRIYRCSLQYDLNNDCVVDFKDFADLTSEWLLCGDPANPNCVP